MNAYGSNAFKTGQRQRAARAQVGIPARIVTMASYQFPELADISLTGAKLKGSPLPPKGTVTLLRAGELEVLSRVVWVKDDQCGIRFEETVSPRAINQVRLAGGASLAVGPTISASAEDGRPADASDI